MADQIWQYWLLIKDTKIIFKQPKLFSNQNKKAMIIYEKKEGSKILSQISSVDHIFFTDDNLGWIALWNVTSSLGKYYCGRWYLALSIYWRTDFKVLITIDFRMLVFSRWNYQVLDRLENIEFEYIDFSMLIFSRWNYQVPDD